MVLVGSNQTSSESQIYQKKITQDPLAQWYEHLHYALEIVGSRQLYVLNIGPNLKVKKGRSAG